MKSAAKIFRVQSLGLVSFKQTVNGFLIVSFQQVKNFVDVFLADVNVAFAELLNHALVRPHETVKRQAERVKTAFEAFHHQDFHELGEVALALPLLFLDIALEIRRVVCSARK